MKIGLLVACMAAGCGRLGFDDHTVVLPDPGSNDQAIPEACVIEHFPEIAIADPDVDLSIAPNPDGVVVVWAPLAGGDLSGAALGADWTLVANPGVIKTGPFFGTAATWIDDTAIIAELEQGEDIKIDTDDAMLSSDYETTCPSGTAVSKTPMMTAGSDMFALTGWTVGMMVTPFDTSWNAGSTALTVPTDSPSAIASTTQGSDVVVAWSTPSGCFSEQLVDSADGTGAQSATPCDAPRLATTPSAIALAYQDASGIELSQGAFGAFGPDSATWLVVGSSPRIAFDGTRLWIAYLDANGQLAVGHITSSGALKATGLDVTPSAHAYELAIIDGAAWTISADATGITATMLCLPN